MLTFEKLAEISEELASRLELSDGELAEINLLLSPVAAETEVYIREMVARVETYERCIILQTFGDDTMEDLFEDDDDQDDGE